MTSRRIVGICLVRNEERFLDLVLTNIIDFCDQILIADNKSTDRTPEIAKRWAKEYASVSVTSIDQPGESHTLLMPFVNTHTWVFAVDGDELYDPHGLNRLRRQILAGSHDAYWRIIGNVLNCTALDMAAGLASGYLSPPSRSITKLYNFSAIDDWSGVQGERLHGGKISFKKGFQESKCLRMHEQVLWEDSLCRCLHLCFMPRSSMDRKPRDGVVTRWNLAEQQSKGLVVFLMAKIFSRIGISLSSRWKLQRYGRGSIVSKEVAAFFPDSKNLPA